MSAKGLIFVGVSVGIMVTGFIIDHYMTKGFEKEVNGAIDRELYDKFGDQLKEARTELVIAKADANKIYNSEIQATSEIVSTNERYLTAKATVEADKKQLNILKNQLKTAQKGNTTSVAAANGSSSVAVSIQDTTQINNLQNDILKLEKEIKENEITRDTIWRTERNTITAARSAEDKAVIDSVKTAEKKLDHVIFEREYYKNNLKEDEKFMDSIGEKAFLNNFKPFWQIVVGILTTIPPAIAIAMIWKHTIIGVKTYYQLKKGV